MGKIIYHEKEYSSGEWTNHYSTEEQFTGKYWIDGKPIYRRVFKDTGSRVFNATFQVYDLFDFSTTDYNLVSISGHGTLNNQVAQQLPYTDIRPNSTQINFYRFNNNKIQLCGFRSDNANVTWANTTVIVEYTKTTD